VGRFGAPVKAKVASNMVKDYELKLLMNPTDVLDIDHKLKSNLWLLLF
jgi:hypothetical protein